MKRVWDDNSGKLLDREDQVGSGARSPDTADSGLQLKPLEKCYSQNNIPPQDAHLLQMIEVALEKLGTGSFGLCEGCGAQICIIELDANPILETCHDCTRTRIFTPN